MTNLRKCPKSNSYFYEKVLEEEKMGFDFYGDFKGRSLMLFNFSIVYKNKMYYFRRETSIYKFCGAICLILDTSAPQEVCESAVRLFYHYNYSLGIRKPFYFTNLPLSSNSSKIYPGLYSTHLNNFSIENLCITCGVPQVDSRNVFNKLMNIIEKDYFNIGDYTFNVEAHNPAFLSLKVTYPADEYSDFIFSFCMIFDVKYILGIQGCSYFIESNVKNPPKNSLSYKQLYFGDVSGFPCKNTVLKGLAAFIEEFNLNIYMSVSNKEGVFTIEDLDKFQENGFNVINKIPLKNYNWFNHEINLISYKEEE